MFTGTFIYLLVILIIVLWHELGHYVMAKYFNWHIHSIVLWIFGGVMKTDEHGTGRLYEDILVTLAGPLQHLFIFLTLIVLEGFQIIPSTLIQMAHHYNLVILLFNLLPIYPLDGGKLMFYLLSLYIPFRKAYHITIIFSMVLPLLIIISQLILYPFTLSAILIMIFILFENRVEWLNRKYVFRRFLLGRLVTVRNKRKPEIFTVHQNDLIINLLSQFKRERTYVIYINKTNSIIKLTERECLKAFFYEKRLVRQFHDIIKTP